MKKDRVAKCRSCHLPGRHELGRRIL
jgi:hypothetical protein